MPITAKIFAFLSGVKIVCYEKLFSYYYEHNTNKTNLAACRRSFLPSSLDPI